MPHGRTGSSAPTERFTVSPMVRCNFVIAHRRGERGIDPYRDFTLSPHIVRFCGCILRGRGRTPPLRLDWQHGQNPHQRAGQDNIKRGMLKRASLFWYRRREYSGGAATSVPPGFSFGTASAARTACRGAKSGRSNDGFSAPSTISNPGALLRVPRGLVPATGIEPVWRNAGGF